MKGKYCAHVQVRIRLIGSQCAPLLHQWRYRMTQFELISEKYTHRAAAAAAAASIVGRVGLLLTLLIHTTNE